MSNSFRKGTFRLSTLGLLKLQLMLAPLCCAWLYATIWTQERQVPNSTSLSSIVGLACSAVFFATALSAFRLRAYSNNSMFIPALKCGLFYSVLFGMFAWGPSIIMDFAHSLDGFLPKFGWLHRNGELNSLLGCRLLLSGAWKEFYRPLSSLPLLFGFYGFIGLVTGICSTACFQIARLLFPHLDITSG